MSISKTIQKMRINPHDWKIEDVKMIACSFKIPFRQPGTSHVTFQFPLGKRITIPAHKRIKSIYITQFIKLLDEIIGD